MASEPDTGRPQAKSVTEIAPVARRRGDVVFAIAALIFAVVMLALIGEQTELVKRLQWTHQPRFWPVVSLGGMALFGLLYAIGSVRDRHREGPSSSRAVELFLWLRAGEFAVWFMVYVFVVPVLGYLVTTILFSALLAYRAGYRTPRMMAYAVVVGIGIVLIFKTFLSVKIPGGAVYEVFPEAVRNFLIVNF
jgi:hypothetical protein